MFCGFAAVIGITSIAGEVVCFICKGTSYRFALDCSFGCRTFIINV